MTETNVHPDPGADDEKIWNDLVAADAKASTDDEPEKVAGKEAETGKADAPADDSAKETTDGKDAGRPAAETADDIWAKASPELRAAHEATRAELERERTNGRRIAGSVAGEQRKARELAQRLEAAEKKAAEKPKAEPDPLDDEAWTAFEAEYPELAKGPVGAMRKRMLAAEAKVGKVETDIGGLTSERYVQNLREHLLFVEDKHPDYGKIKGSDEFAAWYATAPAYVKAGVSRNANEVIDGHEVADILAKFKSETGWAKPANPAGSKDPASPKPPASDKRTLQMESANAPRGRGPAKVSQGPPDDADDEALFDYMVEQDRKEERARNR